MFCVWIIGVQQTELEFSLLPFPDNSLITIPIPAVEAQQVGSEIVFS
jgi:hypothetical protein